MSRLLCRTPDLHGVHLKSLHTIAVHNHTTLLINNINRGPEGHQNVVADYQDVSQDWGHAWFLPHHGQHEMAGNDCKAAGEVYGWGVA